MISLENFDELIYDRTQEDVDVVSELNQIKWADMTNEQKTTYAERLKGALNYTDINRWETWTLRVYNLLEELGIKRLNLDIKSSFIKVSELTETTIEELKAIKVRDLQRNTDYWKMTDIPYKEDIERIINNLKKICEFAQLNNDLEFVNTLDFNQMNEIERLLNELMTRTSQYDVGYVNEIVCGGAINGL